MNVSTMETQTATIVMNPKKFRPKSYTAAVLPTRIICMSERSRLTSFAALYFKLGRQTGWTAFQSAHRQVPPNSFARVCYAGEPDNTFSLFRMGLGGETLKTE